MHDDSLIDSDAMMNQEQQQHSRQFQQENTSIDNENLSRIQIATPLGQTHEDMVAMGDGGDFTPNYGFGGDEQ